MIYVLCEYLQLLLDPAFLLHGHAFLVLFEVLAFGGLQVEPGVGEGLDVGQQRLYKWMEFILKQNKIREYVMYQDCSLLESL